MTSPPSCPRLSRASTSFLRAFSEKDVDSRDKPGHDSGEMARHRNALNPEEPNMRLIAFALAAFVAGGPAAAQTWQEYSYPAYSFTVAFPAEPKIETATHQVADGRSVEAHVYSVSQNDRDRKSTRLNSSHTAISYAVFCL